MVGAVLALAYPLRWLDTVETRFIDLRFAVRGARAPSSRIVLVVISDATFSRLPDHPDLPVAPDLNAELIRRLTGAGAIAIGFDLPELARPTVELTHRFPALAAAIAASGRVVLPAVVAPIGEGVASAVPACVQRFAAGAGHLEKPLELQHGQLNSPRPDLCSAAAGLGALNVYPDRDWTVRSVPLLIEVQGELCPSFALEMARVAQAAPPGQYRVTLDRSVELGGSHVPADSAGEMMVDFAGPDQTYPMLPYEKVVAGDRLPDVVANAVRGRLVIVGSTASLSSRLRTPFSPYMAGVEVNANAVDTLISPHYLFRWGPLVEIPLAVLGVALGLLVGGLRPVPAAGALALLLAMILALSVKLFAAGFCLPMAGSLLGLFVVGSLLAGRSALAEAGERRREADRISSRVSALAGMNTLLNSGLNREQLLRAIMLWVEEEVGCEAASLILLDETDGLLKFEVALGPAGDRLKDVTMEVGEGIVGAVVATGKPLLVPDTGADPRFAKTIAAAVGFPARSILCVPMTLPGRVVGAIEVINKRDGSLFGESDSALLAVIAQDAAMFLEMARLYGILERRVDLANRELRLANQRLSAEKAKIEAIVDHMADGIVAADDTGRIVLVNEAAEAMLGLRAEEVLGQAAAEALPHPELARLFAADPFPAGATRELTFGEPEERVVRAHPALAADEHGVAGRVVVLSDITDLRELDRTKTDMVSFVSHELKNPLTSIKGFAGLIRDHSADLEQREHAEIISRQAGRMYRLIEDFLNIARIDTGRQLEMHWSDSVDLRRIIEEAVEAEAAGRADHVFVIDIPPDTPTLRADPDKLYEIVVNLVNNAAKYAIGGGTITVRAKPENGTEPFSGDVPGKRLRPYFPAIHLSVTDTGIGIKPEHMQHLFKRFRRVIDGTRDRVEGTGLGLFLTRELVHAHGGRIWAESAPGKGSTFHILLPLEGQPQDEADPQD